MEINLGDGTTDYVCVSQGEGLLILTSAGLAGRVSAKVEIKNIPGVGFSGTFAIAINNTQDAVDETFVIGTSSVSINLPEGPYLKIEEPGLSFPLPDRRSPAISPLKRRRKTMSR